MGSCKKLARMSGYNLRLNGSNYGDALLRVSRVESLTLTLVISCPRPLVSGDQSEAWDGGSWPIRGGSGQLWGVPGNWDINHVDTEITTLNTEINVRHYNIIHPDHSDSVIMNEVNHDVASRNVLPMIWNHWFCRTNCLHTNLKRFIF